MQQTQECRLIVQGTLNWLPILLELTLLIQADARVSHDPGQIGSLVWLCLGDGCRGVGGSERNVVAHPERLMQIVCNARGNT